MLTERTTQPRSQGLSSLPPLVVGTEAPVAAGHVTICPSKTAGWVGTQVHLVESTQKSPRVSVPTTKGAEKRDPRNEVADHVKGKLSSFCNTLERDASTPGLMNVVSYMASTWIVKTREWSASIFLVRIHEVNPHNNPVKGWHLSI